MNSSLAGLAPQKHSRRSSPNTHRRGKGFVLLSVLLVLVVVGVILTRMASQGIQISIASSERVEQLQKNWAAQSVERVMLPHVGRVLNEQQRTGSMRAITGAVPVGANTVSFTISDEDAKLNVNQLYRHAGISKTDAALKRIVPPLAGVPQQLRPGVAGGQAPNVAFRSWADVYSLDFITLPQRRLFLPAATTRLTCWGQQKLNYLRCDRAALEEVLKLKLDPQRAGELAESIHANDKIDIQAAMLAAEIDEQDREELASLITRVSTCWSLKTEILPQPRESGSTAGNFASTAIVELPTMNNEDEPAPAYRFYRFLY